MGSLCKKAIFCVLGAILLCLPATAFAMPLDDAIEPTEAEVTPLQEATEAIEAPYLSKDVVTAGKELLVSIGSTSGIKLIPGGMYEIFLDDTSLGSYHADYNGQLFVQVKIPANTTPGTHTLKTTNQALTLQKTIKIINI